MKSIRELREAAGLTQGALAEKIGVDRTAVVKWETGVAFPSSAKLPKLAEVLGCGIADLFAVPEKKDGE